MEDEYMIYDPDITETSSPLSLSTVSRGRMGRYQARSMENTAMTVLNMQCEQVAFSQAIASHSRITGMTLQAAELYPMAAERFYSLAEQHYQHLANILETSIRR